MIFSHLLRLINRRFLSQPKCLQLVLLHQVRYGSIQVCDPSDQICNINLHTSFLTAINKLLSLVPFKVNSNEVESSLDDSEYVVTRIEVLRLNLFAIIINKKFSGNTDLKSFLGIKTHDEEESDKSPNKSPNIRKIVVNFVELS